MDKVDRLGWTVGFAREYRGLKLGFRADRSESLQVLLDLVAPLSAQDSGAVEVEFLFSYRGGGQRGTFRDFHLLYQGARKVVRTLDARELMAALQLEVNMLIGVAAPDTICLQGGAVLRRGKAVLVLGEEARGTPALLSALEKAGATPLTDAFVLLDASSGRLLTHGQPEVGAAFAAGPFLRKRSRHRRLEGGEAALCLFQAAPAAALQAQRLLPALARFANVMPVFAGDRSCVARAAEAILKLTD